MSDETQEVWKLGDAELSLYKRLKGMITFSDFCAAAGTIEFKAYQDFLSSRGRLFLLKYPGYELEARVHDGKIFIRRDEHYQHSEEYLGREPCDVAIQWDADSISCGARPSSSPTRMDDHMRAVRTPLTVPPLGLVQTLRMNNLLSSAAYRTPDDLFMAVVDSLHLVEQDIRRHGGESFAWGKGNDKSRPLDEPSLSKLVAGYLSVHGGQRNFDVMCEPEAGTGNIDFYVVGPILNQGLGRVAIEAKKADSDKLIHGFSVQLPTYMARLQASHGIFLTYWLKSERYPHPGHDTYAALEIEALHPLPRAPGVRTVGIDLSCGPTPSRA